MRHNCKSQEALSSTKELGVSLCCRHVADSSAPIAGRIHLASNNNDYARHATWT